MTATGWHVRQQLPGGITAAMVAHGHRGEHARTQVNCPRGDGVWRAQEGVCRPVATMGGPVPLERPYGSCRLCRVGCSPCDEALGVVAGGKQRARPQAGVPLGTAVPDDTAQALLGALTGMACGSARRPTVPKQVGATRTVVDVAPAREELRRRMASVAAGRLRRPGLGLGLDGASGPTRPTRAWEPQAGRRHTRAKRARWRGQWRAAPGVRCSGRAGERIVPGRRWHHVHSDEPRGEARKQLKEAGLMPADPVRLGVVCAGAEWRWQHVQALWPHARQGRADSPGAPSRHRVAQAPEGASVQAVEWGEATMPRLSLGHGGVVLGGWRRMPAPADEAEKARAHCWDGSIR